MRLSNLTTIFSFFFLLSSINISYGQCPSGLWVQSQETVDSFSTRNPGCNVVKGDLEIGSPWSERDISDLLGLSSIEVVEGNLSIDNLPNLTCLEGLLKLR